MRRLMDGNKRVISLFSIIIIVIIALLIVFLIYSLTKSSDEYIVSSGAIAYDVDYNQIKLNNEGKIEKKWDGNYYLYDSESNSYNLGKQAIIYDIGKSKLTVIGTIYKVLLDGQVEKYNGNNEITNLNEDFIYKLADRKYIITGSRIVNESGTLNTEDFLLTVLDQAGNTLMANNVLDAKTINPMIIYTASFKFDVANEKLVYENQDIDLKKIIGSTNKYIEKEEPIGADKNQDETNNNNITNTNESTNNTSNDNAISEEINNNNVNITNNTNNSTSNDSIKKSTLSKYIEIKSITSSTSYIDINYIVNDPENKYQIVYVNIEANNFEKSISLDKSVTTYRVTDLSPDTEYLITVGYKEILADNSIADVIDSIETVKTKKIGATLQITRLTFSKIFFTLKLDANYLFSSGKIVVYTDGVKGEEMDINIEEASRSRRMVF